MPATGNKKAPGAYGRKNKPNLGRTKSEVGLGKSMAASGKKVSGTNLGKPSPSPPPKPPKAPRARQNPLAGPSVQSAVERLRSRYTDTGRTVEEARRQTEANVRQRESRVADIAASQVKLDPAVSRTDFIGKQNDARQNTALSGDGKTVKKFGGKGIVGTPSTKSVARAAKEGSLRGKKRLTTPEVRKTTRQVRKARRQVQKARAAVQTPRRNLVRAGLDPEQARILTTVLKTGRKMGATKKELLAATMTALVESNISNPATMTDHDSLGWRQERASQYGANNAMDVRGGAKRFFEESVSDTGGTRGRGMLAGDLAQTIQGSAFPDRYEERRPEATALLRAFRSAGNASPKAKRQLNRAENKLERVSERAAELGLKPKEGQGKKAGSPDWVLVDSPENVRSAIQVLGKDTLDKWLPAQGGGTSNYPRNVYNLNPVLARQLVKLAKATGQPITITSGYRSVEDQANIDSGVNPKAPPGLSSHQFGMAADVEMTDEQAARASEFGLEHGEAGAGVSDPPHTELTDAALIKEALKYGPIRSSYAPAGVPLSEGDLGSWKEGGVSGGSAAPSSYSGGGSTGTNSGGVASGPAGRSRRQATILDTLRRPGVATALRDMGFRVTSNGVVRIDGGSLSKTEFEAVKKRMGIE